MPAKMSHDTTTDIRPQEIGISQPPEKSDIEHATVNDDPRKWSRARKYIVVATISAASMIAGLGSNIYNPAISQIEEQLHASSGDISLSLSLFIAIQGSFPLIWTAISEFQGRKRVYIASIALCTVGCAVAATAKTIGVLIGMRCLQALGSSAVMSIGAATLADIYEPAERGTMMGIYYSAPLLGPSLGPILGGLLTEGFDWRATFWFLVIFTGLCCISFFFFKDTFRRERSLVYQSALRRAREQQAARRSETSSLSNVTAVSRNVNNEKEAMEYVESTEDVPGLDISRIDMDAQETRSAKTMEELKRSPTDIVASKDDVEAQITPIVEAAPIEEIKLSWLDVNPVKPIVHVLRRMNNLTILTASGFIYAFSYCISYTCSRTLANEYSYNALQIGLVLLAFGVGSLLGSMLGGRYSDHVFSQLKAKNGGQSHPEMRLQSTMLAMIFLPPSVIAYGWVCEEHVHVAAICIMLFLSGFFSICIYSSTLAYIVDANNGRSSSAVATNSCFRGIFAFVAAEVAIPLQDTIGDGGMYSLWGGIMVVSELLILLVWWKGGEWREKWEARERQHQP